MGKGEGQGKGKGGCGCGDGKKEDWEHLRAISEADELGCGCGDKDRCCTDILMLIAFIAFCIGMFVVLGIADAKSDMNRIFYGSDWRGKVCGSGSLKSYDNQYWPNPYYFRQLGSVCLESCPTSSATNTTATTHNVTTTDTINADAYLVCTCNNQLTVGMTTNGVLFPQSYGTTTSLSGIPSSTYSDDGSTCSSAYSSYSMENSLQYANSSYLGGLCNTASAQTMGYVMVPNSACNQKLLWSYLPSATISGTNAYFTNTTSVYSGKFNVPICNYMYKTYETISRCVPWLTYEEMLSMFCGTGGNCDTHGDLKSQFEGISNTLSQIIADLGKCWYIILTSFLIAIVCGFIYLAFMKYCTCFVVWCGLIGSMIMMTLITFAFYDYYGQLKDRVDITPQLDTYESDKTNMNICLGFTITFAVLTCLLVCMVVCMCKQINTACTVLALAADGVMDMPLLLVYPIALALMILAFGIMWVYGALFLASAGDNTTNVIYGYAEYEFDNTLKYMCVYWLFGLLWITEFFCAVGFMIVAFSFCIWFFTDPEHGNSIPKFSPDHYVENKHSLEAADDQKKDGLIKVDVYIAAKKKAEKDVADPKNPTPEEEAKIKEYADVIKANREKNEADLKTHNEEHGLKEGKEITASGRILPRCIIGLAAKLTIMHHLGTCAFGSLIIAIIQMARIVLEYVERKQKELGGDPGPLWKFIFCCMKCFLWCLEKCMRFLNKTAYIMTCMNGTNFCGSACHAAWVLITKADYVFITIIITNGMLFFGKLVIALGTAAIGGWWCTTVPDLTSIVFPTLIMLFIGFAIAILFCEVYEMGIDTVLMCYLEAESCHFPASKLPQQIRSHFEKQEEEHHANQAAEGARASLKEGRESKEAGVEVEATKQT